MVKKLCLRMAGAKHSKGKPMSNHKAWLSVNETAYLLGIHPNTLRRWCSKGVLEWYELPNGRGDKRFRPGDIEAFIETVMKKGHVTPQG